jgi:hypothetical protein
MSSNRNTFIVPTDAHYYKIIEMLKQFKIIILYKYAAVTLTASIWTSTENHFVVLAKHRTPP